MKRIQLPIIFCFIAILFSVLSCKKTDLAIKSPENSDASIEAHFFNDHRTNDPTEAKLVNFVKNKYGKENIAEKIIKIVGFPRWNKISVYKDQNASLVNTSNTTTTYYIPLVIDSQNFVNAAMAIQASATDTTLTYLQDWQYINKQNNINSYNDIAEHYAVFFMRQDMNVFGYKTFKILDSNLFRFNNHRVDSIKLETQVNSNNNLVLITTSCQTVDLSFNCTGGSAYNINNMENKCHLNYDYCTTSTLEIYTGGVPSGGTPGGGGGGGGGGWISTLTMTPTEAAIFYITSALNLDGLQWWFEADPNRGVRAIEMQDYLIANNSSPQAIALCNAHFNKMKDDAQYLAFVISHAVNGDNSKMWWEDTVWLSNPNNFSLDIENSINNTFEELTPQEIALIALYPTAAFTIKSNVDKAFSMANSKFGASGGLNDKKDAFRHAFFNAINARDVFAQVFPTPNTSANIVTLFANAHEQLTPPLLSLEKDMDLHNNNVGILYCSSCIPGIDTDNQIANAIMVRLNNGDLYYLKPTRVPKYDQNGVLINNYGDPNFYGINGILDLQTATHGIYYISIYNCTILENTNN